MGYILAVEYNFTFVGLYFAGNKVEKSGFACAIGADNAQYLALIHFKAEIVNRSHLTERLA